MFSRNEVLRGKTAFNCLCSQQSPGKVLLSALGLVLNTDSSDLLICSSLAGGFPCAGASPGAEERENSSGHIGWETEK